MPSSPKISKDLILAHALKMLIRDGYAALNIKTLAKEIGCSTQPISWHFGNMEGFRKELTAYALDYANQKMLSSINGKGMEDFAGVGAAYVSLAFDESNLFKYLYMSGESGLQAGGFDVLFKADANASITRHIAEELNIPKKNSQNFLQNTMVYTHGLACFIASGVIVSSKEEVIRMVHRAAQAFLSQAEKIQAEENDENRQN